MSGFEIIGVVLGAVPLLISGFEYYKKGLIPAKDFLNYEYVVKDNIRGLNVNRCILRNTCEKLLRGLVYDEELADLLESASRAGNSALWRRPDLDEKLKDRLGYSYDSYLETVSRLVEMIDVFRKKMGLDSNFRPTWIEKPDRPDTKSTRDLFFGDNAKRKSIKLWKRVKLGLDHHEFKDLIEEMGRENLRLDLLTRTNLELEPIRKERSRGMDTKYWKGIRNLAIRLFECLVSQWPCRCGHPHIASLHLDNRTGNRATKGTETTFRIVFMFSTDTTLISGTPWTWRDTQIKSIEILPNLQPPASFSSSSLSGGRNVPFNTPASPPSTRSSSPLSPLVAAIKIENLCSSLSLSEEQSCCLGYLDNKEWQHHIYLSSDQQPTTDKPVASSLDQYLTHGTNRTPTVISIKDRYELAVLLSSTVLQLYNTPWLNDNWTRHDIYLLHGCSQRGLAKELYLSKEFSLSTPPISTDVDPYQCLIRNTSVFNLGLVLLELTFGHPIENFFEELDTRNGIQTAATKLETAGRLLRKIEEYEGKRYSDVISRCVYCDFGTRVTSFADDDFRQKFYEGVVVPLEDILHDFIK